MRVIVVGAAADSSIRDVERGWVRALERAGHDVRLYNLNARLKLYGDWFRVVMEGARCREGHVAIDPEPGFIADQVTIMQAASECVAHEALRHRAEMAVIISGCSFHPNGAAFLQAIGVPVVTIATESPYNDADMVDLARISTIVGTNERRSVPHFAALAGEAATYLPTAYDTDRHAPGPIEPDKACDVFFVGTGFDERARLFAETDWSGIDFKLAGFWPTGEDGEVIPTATEARLGQIKIGHDARLARHLARGLIDNDEAVAWYRSARIVLAIHRDAVVPRSGAMVGMVGRGESIGPRVYEAAAVGAFQIADDSRPELAELFGDSIPTFRAGDPEHLRWTIRYWLDRPALRQDRASEARQRVRGHSYDDRLMALMRLIADLRRAA